MPPKATSNRRLGASRNAPGTTPVDSNSDPPSAPTGSSVSPNANTSSSASGGTVATTPSSRPPVQRLQSLRGRPTPGPGIVPRPSNMGSREGNGSSPKPVIKYGPRNFDRRSKEERQAIVNTEAQRNRQRLLEVAEIQRVRAAAGGHRIFRGSFRGRGGRGPGAFQTRNEGTPFAQTVDSRDSSAARHSTSRQTTTATNKHNDISSDEEGDYRSDFKTLDLSQNDKKKGKGVEVGGGLLPVRLEVRLHEDRPIASSRDTIKDSQPIIKNDTGETEPEQGLEPQIKAEPIDSNMDMASLSPHVGESRGESDTLLPSKGHVQTTEANRGTMLGPNEEAEEYERRVTDLEEMKALLAIECPQSATEKNSTAASDDKEEDITVDKHQGKLYLFQFPPATPNLLVADGHDSAVNNTNNPMAHRVDDNQTAPPTGKQPTQNIVKQEEGEPEVEEVDASGKSRQPRKLITACQKQLPLGRVGQLHVHASGRVTMDWGGISFNVDLAQKVNFAQDALVVSPSKSSIMTVENSEGPAATTAGAGAAGAVRTEIAAGPAEATMPNSSKIVWAMGGLEAKFIAQPNWENLI